MSVSTFSKFIGVSGQLVKLAELQATTIGVQGVLSLSPTSPTHLKFRAGHIGSLPVPQVVDGIVYDGAEDGLLEASHSSPSNESIQSRFMGTFNRVSMAFRLKTTLLGNTWAYFDLPTIVYHSTAGWVSAVLQIRDAPGAGFGIHAHGSSPVGSTGGVVIPLTVGGPAVWVSLMADGVAGKCRVMVHNAAGAILGESECNVSAGPIDNPFFIIGNTNDHGSNPQAVTQFSNWLISLDGEYPLGLTPVVPPEPPPPPPVIVTRRFIITGSPAVSMEAGNGTLLATLSGESIEEIS